MRPARARRTQSKGCTVLMQNVTEGEPRPLNLVWGVDQIAKIIRTTPRRAHYLCATGQLKGVRQIGTRWVADVEALQAQFCGD